MPLERISFKVMPLPWCCIFSWKCFMSRRDTWWPLGRMAGCLTWGWSSACVNLPPTRKISWSSINGLNLYSLLDWLNELPSLVLEIWFHRQTLLLELYELWIAQHPSFLQGCGLRGSFYQTLHTPRTAFESSYGFHCPLSNPKTFPSDPTETSLPLPWL